MSTPTAGPDDRSPTLSDEQFSRVEEWANDSTMEPDRRFDLLAILSALRSARRDVAAQRASVIREVVDIINHAREEGEVDPRAIRARVEQLASSPPILEKNDR